MEGTEPFWGYRLCDEGNAVLHYHRKPPVQLTKVQDEHSTALFMNSGRGSGPSVHTSTGISN